VPPSCQDCYAVQVACQPDGLTRITVTVSPGAARSELVGRHGDGWNEALVVLLAHALRVPRARISVVGGQTARRKVVEVEGLSQDEIERRLDG
jgi:uncharacterized protein YggU (UPF0235/DUF167 family)